jgi:hypothetical protein
MKPRFRRLFNHDREVAASMLQAAGSLAPMFVLHAHDGQIIPLVVAEGTKEDGYRAVRLAAVAFDVEAVAQLGEAWALLNADRTDVAPEDSERRVEILSVLMATCDEMVGSGREILRDGAGNITGLGPERIPPRAVSIAGNAEGLMTGVVPRQRPSPAMRQAAKSLLDAISESIPGRQSRH